MYMDDASHFICGLNVERLSTKYYWTVLLDYGSLKCVSSLSKLDWPNVNDIMSSWAEGALDIFKNHSPFSFLISLRLVAKVTRRQCLFMSPCDVFDLIEALVCRHTIQLRLCLDPSQSSRLQA